MELKEDMAVVWRCCDNHYVGVIPCVIVAITEKRVKVAVLLANGKIGLRYADKEDLGPIDMHEIESILLNVRCGLGLKKIKEQS